MADSVAKLTLSGNARARNETPPPRADRQPVQVHHHHHSFASDSEEESGTAISEDPEEPPLTDVEIANSLVAQKKLISAMIFFVIVAFIFGAMAAGPAKNHVQGASNYIASTWKAVTQPLEEVLTTRSDLIVGIAAAACFSPFVVVLLILILRTLSDLRFLTPLQKVCLSSLVMTALATASWFTEGVLWSIAGLQSFWNVISDPLETVLVKHADNIILGVAVALLSPFALTALVLSYRCVFGFCPGKSAVEKTSVEPKEVFQAEELKNKAKVM